MKLPTRLYVVTKPTPASTMQDICFSVDLKSLELQFKGGLDAFDIYAIYTTQAEARTAATLLLDGAIK